MRCNVGSRGRTRGTGPGEEKPVTSYLHMRPIGLLRFGRLKAPLLVLPACVPLGVFAGPEVAKSPSSDREPSSVTVRKPPFPSELTSIWCS
jgi:hypothetical protein